MTISRFLRGFTLGSVIMTTAIGMETSMKFRAQDDETLGGLKLLLTIPTSIKDGPEDKYIKIMVDDSNKAVKDPNGNFLEYTNVDLEGEIVPNVSLLELKSPDGKWPPTEAKVLIESKNHKKEYQLKVHKKNSIPYYIAYDGFFYDLPFAQNYQPNRSYPLEPLDNSGRKLQTRSVEQMPFFDLVSIFGAVHYVLDMYTKDINELGSVKLKNKWDRRGVIQIYPYVDEKIYNSLPKQLKEEKYEDNLGNAFYIPVKDSHYLCFFPFSKGGAKTTGQSTDIVWHETSHYILHILRPDLRRKNLTSYDIVAFDESMGDLSAFFALASIKEVATKIIASTHGNLETSSFFSVFGETLSEFRRDATSKTDLSKRPSCEEHVYSERFTKAIYGTLADGFNYLKRSKISPSLSEATILTNTATTLRRLFLESVMTIPAENFNFANFGRNLEDLAQKNIKTSFFTGHIFHNFAKQGIDLNNKVWMPICIPDAEDKSKITGVKRIYWVCSSSLISQKKILSYLSNTSSDESSIDSSTSEEYSSEEYFS